MKNIASDKMYGIVGLGQTGMSCARYLHEQGHLFVAFEENESAAGVANFTAQFPDYKCLTGALLVSELAACSDLLVSPGVPLTHPAIAAARQAGVNILCDVDLFAQAVSVPIVAITGSNAKSTVTAMVGAMAKQAGLSVGICGNIGIPALNLLLDSIDYDLFVLELSSFQLERMQPLHAAVACVLNITPDHMDRYASLMDYHAAKHRIFRACRAAVANRADPLTTPLLAADVPLFTFGLDTPDFNGFGLVRDQGDEWIAWQFEDLMPCDELSLQGRHNIENALAALAIGRAAKLPIDAMLSSLRNFKGLPHRCEWVRDIDGVAYYNDSKGTNVGATRAAIQGLAALDHANIVLIAGGVGKGADFSQLSGVMGHCKALVVFGQDAVQIESALAGKVPTHVHATSLEAAVTTAASLAASGDTVLFSPACASFDMFANYVERGEAFVRVVSDLSGASDD